MGKIPVSVNDMKVILDLGLNQDRPPPHRGTSQCCWEQARLRHYEPPLMGLYTELLGSTRMCRGARHPGPLAVGPDTSMCMPALMTLSYGCSPDA